MNERNLPPLPPPGATGLDVCSTIQLYLAVFDDVTPQQAQVVSAHVRICPECAREQQLLRRTSRLVASLDVSQPSAHVDRAVLAAIAARSRETASHPVVSFPGQKARRRRTPVRLVGLIAAAAVLLVALYSSLQFLVLPSMTQMAFALPANLTWNNYVLYHQRTEMSSDGEPYQISTYYDFSTNHVHVETVMGGELEVMVVGDNHDTLGMDMKKHVAQWGADNWRSDESTFNLTTLRADLQAKRAVYLGKDHFKGQDVYRIRTANGDVLLLDMSYRPVNVLEHANDPNGGKPMYDTLKLLSPSTVPEDTWNMTVPPGFKMGNLPKKP